MKHLFKTSSWGQIEKVTVLRETASTVWFTDPDGTERKERRDTNYGYKFFDTYSDAYSYLVDVAVKNQKAAQERLDSANKFLGRIHGMVHPKEQPERQAEAEQVVAITNHPRY